jgi:hypothetical protein
LRYDPRIVVGPDWEFFIRYSELATFGYVDDRTCLYRVHRANITTRVAADQRAASLALCREKAIKLDSFGACGAETRTAVFYDLLINWLRDQPARREALTECREFAGLPALGRARLLRLMASDAILHEKNHDHVDSWLQRARAVNPADRRAQVIADQAPFADLFASVPGTPSR